MTDGDDELAAWVALEATWQDPEVLRADLVRIRGYALACMTKAAESRDALELAVTALVKARSRAEQSLSEARAMCEHAERMCAFAARAMAGDVDVGTRREAAEAIDGLERRKTR